MQRKVKKSSILPTTTKFESLSLPYVRILDTLNCKNFQWLESRMLCENKLNLTSDSNSIIKFGLFTYHLKPKVQTVVSTQ